MFENFIWGQWGRLISRLESDETMSWEIVSKFVRTITNWESAYEYYMTDFAEVAGDEQVILCLMVQLTAAFQ